MNSGIMDYFEMHRSLFGLCPKCHNLFRLSESRVFLKTKPTPDWMDSLQRKSGCLDRLQERLQQEEGALREEAREKGRQQAQRLIKKVDPIFRPQGLNPDDAKDVVFDGMKLADHTKRIVLLDRQTKEHQQKALQKSIEKTIEKGRFDWETLSVREDGSIEKQ
jgi:predicted Holliday junction resolvase-like endonuclease